MAARTVVRTERGKDSKGHAGTWRYYSSGAPTFTADSSGGDLSISAAQQYENNQKKGATPGAKPVAAVPAAPAATSTPTVDPFFTPDDLLNINAYQGQYDDTEAGIKRGLTDLETDTTAKKHEIDDAAVKNTNATQENAAARGIFQSSIKDANVYDIEAQRRINNQLLDDHLTTARLDAQSRLGKLADRRQDFNKAMAGKKVQNAQAVTPVVPTPAPAPTPTTPIPVKGPIIKNSLGHMGHWNTYPDGRKVWVPA